jgi:hypothetical protein
LDTKSHVFTKSNGTRAARVYERLRGRSRRRFNRNRARFGVGWTDAAYEAGYLRGAYETLKVVRELQEDGDPYGRDWLFG